MQNTGRLAGFVRITPRYLALTLSPEEELAIDDALLARGIALEDAIAWMDPRLGLYDLERGAAPLEDLAWTTLGRRPTRLVHVEGLLPFDWRSFDGLASLERAMPRLPDFIPGRGPFRFFGVDESRPPFLWASHESVGLQVASVVDDEAWAAWVAALARETLEWPLRVP